MTQQTLSNWRLGPEAKKRRTSGRYNSESSLTPTDSDFGESSSASSQAEPSTSQECASECCKYSSTISSPYLIKSPAILRQTRKLQGTKWRQFSPDWFETYTWLILCTTTLRAYCHFCKYCTKRGLLTDKHVDSVFVSVGFDNWKKAHERFKKHAQSNSHREAMMKVEQMKQPGIDAQLSTQLKQSQQLHFSMLMIQLSSLRFLLRQGLAIRGHDEIEGNLFQLLLLRKEECPDLIQWIESKRYLSSDIINEIIGIMGHHVLREILREIRESVRYSLIADESMDSSNKEQLCISIRWVDNSFNIHEDPVELIDVPKTDSEMLTTLIKDCLVRFSLPLSQCRGQAYDGASNMRGHISGVAARIQEIEPTAIYVHCLAHSTNLCLQTVGRKISAVREALDLVMELSQFIRFSAKRSALFQSLQAQLTPGAPSLKPLCPTRWTVRTRAIQAVISNYEVLKTAMIEIHDSGRDEYALKAGGYLTTMDNFSTYFGLKLSHLIFSATEQFSTTLQGCNTTMQEAVDSADLAIKFLRSQRNDVAFSRFYSRIVEDSKQLTSEPRLPRYRRAPKRFDGHTTNTHRFVDAESYFKQQYYEALETAAGELQSRFQQTRGMPIAAAMEKTLLNSANNGDCHIPEEVKLYSKEIDIERLKIQLQMLPDLIRTYNQKNPVTSIKKVTSLRTLCEVMSDVSCSKSLLPEVFSLLHTALTIPITSATAKRAFSALRRLKNFLRSTMTQPRLNHVMLLHIHKDRTDKIDLTMIAKEFISVNERRRTFFGQF